MTELQTTAFPKLDDEQLAALDEFATCQSFRDGETLFAVGDSDFKFFIVKQGNVEIVEESSGKQKRVTIHEEKEFTGDVTMLTGKPSPVSAIARGNCQVYEISSPDLKKILKEVPKLGDCILQAFLTRRELLEESEFMGLRIVGSKYSRDTFRIRDFLAKNRIPSTWIDLEADQSVSKLLEHFEIRSDETPVVAFGNNKILKNPSNEELGETLKLKKPLQDTVYDLVIVGAGPAGLAAAVYGASEGLNTVVLEKNAPGGQAGCSSKIENYMGFPTGLSGTDLANRAHLQAQKFGAQFSTPSEVVGMEFDSAYSILLLKGGDRISAQCVLIATGVTYRRLPVEGGERFESGGVYYSATTVEAQLCRGSTVIVVGGANSAGQAAIFLSRTAQKVLLMIRGDDLSKKMSQYLTRRIEQTDNIEVLTHTEITKMTGDEILSAVEVVNNQTNESRTIETAAVFIFIGAVPHTEWLPLEVETDEKGFVKTGSSMQDSQFWQRGRQPFLLETSRPGVFAAGDVRQDSMKRVASSVGEGSMTVQFVHQVLSQ